MGKGLRRASFQVEQALELLFRGVLDGHPLLLLLALFLDSCLGHGGLLPRLAVGGVAAWPCHAAAVATALPSLDAIRRPEAAGGR